MSKYLSTTNLAEHFDCSPDFFYKLIKEDEVHRNIHFIKKGKFIRWDILEMENFFKEDEEVSEDDEIVNSLMNDLLK